MVEDSRERLILKALRKARRPLSTRKISIRTRMDWETAKNRLKKLKSTGKVHTKKVGSKRLWSIKKIKQN